MDLYTIAATKEARMPQTLSRTLRTILSAMLVCMLFPGVALAAADVGKVIAFTPGASALRDGKTEVLALHAGLWASDTLRTDASGRMKMLFNDDSAVSLGSNTTVAVSEYLDTGDKPAFGLNVPQGVVRVMTGKIVEQNPAGFKITTPEAVVGIRGTTISLIVENGQTTVLVENTLRQVIVNNVVVPGGHKIVLPSALPRPEPILPEDRRQLGRLLALHGGPGVAAAAPEPVMDSGTTPTEQLVAVAKLIPPDTALTDIALATQGLTVAPAGALVQGTLSNAGLTPFGALAYSDFNFAVDLASGAITNAAMSGGSSISTTTGNHFSATGGSGTYVSGGSTTFITGFSGTAWSGGMGGTAFPITPGDNSMLTLDPGADVSSFAQGSVTGLYTINATGWTNADYGTISGRRVR